MAEWKVHLLDDLDGVRRRIEKTSQYISDMLDAVKDRIAIERYFADALASAAMPAPDDCYPSVGCGAFVFGDHARRRAEHSRRFAANLESLAPGLAALLELSNEVLAPILAEGLRIQKELHQEYRAHDSAVVAFDATARVADAAALRAMRIPPEPRARLKAAEAARATGEREKSYAAAVAGVNRKRAETAAALEPVMDSLEAAENRRLASAEEIWRNFLAFELEFTKSAEFDLNATLAGACAEREESDARNFLKSEIDQVTLKKGKPPGRESLAVEMTPLTWQELQATMPSGRSPAPAFSPAPAPAAVETDAAARDWLLAFLGPRVSGPTLELSEADFSTLEKSATEILDLALRLKNFEAARIIWESSRKIFGEEMLHAKIHEHAIFNETAFWEDAAAATVADHFLLPQRRRSLGAEISLFEFLHVKIEEFPVLAAAFGLSADFTKNLVLRVLDSHAEILGSEKSFFEAAMIGAAPPVKVGKPQRPPK